MAGGAQASGRRAAGASISTGAGSSQYPLARLTAAAAAAQVVLHNAVLPTLQCIGRLPGQPNAISQPASILAQRFIARSQLLACSATGNWQSAGGNCCSRPSKSAPNKSCRTHSWHTQRQRQAAKVRHLLIVAYPIQLVKFFGISFSLTVCERSTAAPDRPAATHGHCLYRRAHLIAAAAAAATHTQTDGQTRPTHLLVRAQPPDWRPPLFSAELYQRSQVWPNAALLGVSVVQFPPAPLAR